MLICFPMACHASQMPKLFEVQTHRKASMQSVSRNLKIFFLSNPLVFIHFRFYFFSMEWWTCAILQNWLPLCPKLSVWQLGSHIKTVRSECSFLASDESSFAFAHLHSFCLLHFYVIARCPFAAWILDFFSAFFSANNFNFPFILTIARTRDSCKSELCKTQ